MAIARFPEGAAVSLRSRLSLAVALVLLLTLVLASTAILGATRTALVGQVDDQLRAFAVRAGPRPDGHGPGSGPDSDGHPGTVPGPEPAAGGAGGAAFVERPIGRYLYGPAGLLLVSEPAGFPDDPDPPPDLPANLAPLVNQIVTVGAGGSPMRYRVLIQRTPADAYLVSAAPLAATNAALSRLGVILAVVGVVALIAAAAASWWLIGRALRPVDRMIDTASAIAAGDLSRRVPDADPRSELGQLGGALNEMLSRIERAARAREASEERLRRFVADAAHELRTPLTSLRGYAELYRQGALPDEAAVAGAMRRIEGEGGRMARLIDDLLLLARLDQQRGIEGRPIYLVRLARDAVAYFRVVAPDRPIDEQLCERAIVQGDPMRLRQVIDNLLANARTHTPPGTPVHVIVETAGDAVELTVADEGPGVPPDARDRIFERFWRADPGRGRQTGGSGLGLAIVDSLVRAHGGEIALTSEAGAGARFTVRLPLAPVEATKPEREESPADSQQTPRLRTSGTKRRPVSS